MPGLVTAETPHYVPAPATKVDLDYADLPVIDFSEMNTTEGRSKLAQKTRDAMAIHGFLYVINHGYATSETERIFDIADIPFSRVGDEEKRAYIAEMKETGSYQGYKPRQYWHIDAGVRDQLEHYNINRDVYKRQHPEVLRPFLPEIEMFAHHSHEDVLYPILRLLAVGMEIPEETFVDMHRGRTNNYTFVRFMKYYPRSEEEETKTKNVWFKGHTDFGTITILYSQPVAALQILTKDGTWKWVKHIENALVINVGDSIELMSGGFYRATIHRVVQPPPDQRNYTRLGAFYFATTDDDVKLAPIMESPVLQRLGVFSRSLQGAEHPTTESWRKARIAAYGQTELKAAKNGVEEEVINGVVVKHYN